MAYRSSIRKEPIMTDKIQRTDPTGRIEPLNADIQGAVPIETTMRKPEAYRSGTPRSTTKQEN